MIKFFRNIRKKLASENKFMAYSRYAIGEIVLVVIGILIALQINNWNEERKARIEERGILINLSSNLILAKQQSETLILEEKRLKNLIIGILELQPEENKGNNVITDSIFKEAVWDLQSDLPILNAYINLKNTNKLSLIKSKQITEKFTSLDFNYNKLNDLLKDRLAVHQIRIDNILEKEINFIPLIKSNIPDLNTESEVPSDYRNILEQERIRNLLGMKLTFTQDVINKRKDLDKEIELLIQLIETELNNPKDKIVQ